MLKLYENIRKRREELDMTQEELAKRMGYTSRSSIQKIEVGRSDLPVSRISLFASVLGVSEAWLLGIESPDGYSDLDAEDKGVIKGEIKQMLRDSKYKKHIQNSEVS